MSFDNLHRLEAQSSSTQLSTYPDGPTFDCRLASFTNQISALNNSVSRLSSLLEQVGGRRDSEGLREHVKGLLIQTREEFKVTGEYVKKVQCWKGLSSSQRYAVQKLSSTFSSILRRFQSLQRISTEKTSQCLLGTSPKPKLMNRDQARWQAQLQLPQQAVTDQLEVEFQESIVLQREEEIQSLQRGIEDINNIYKSLAAIVNLQEGDLNDIAASAAASVESFRKADNELRHTLKGQKVARKRACCVLLLSAVLLGIVLLAVLAG